MKNLISRFRKIPVVAAFWALAVVNFSQAATYSIELQEAINGRTSLSGSSGVQLLTQYIAAIYSYLASIIGLVAVLYIVFSGMQIVLGGIQQDMVQKAKSRILNSILSLCLLFGSALLLKYVNAQFFGGTNYEDAIRQIINA